MATTESTEQLPSAIEGLVLGSTAGFCPNGQSRARVQVTTCTRGDPNAKGSVMSTNDRILEAAMRIVEHEGLRGATTRRIAEEAGVNEVTLFRRFGSKERLLLEVMQRRAESPARSGALPLAPVDPSAELRAWCVQHVVEMEASRGLVRAVFSESFPNPAVCQAAREHPRRLRVELASYLDRVRAAGHTTGDWDANAAARMLLGALFSNLIADRDPDGSEPFSPDAIADRYVPLVLRAIGIRTRGSE